MRRSLPLLVLLLATTACGQADRRRDSQFESPSNAMGAADSAAQESRAPPATRFEAADSRTAAGPNVSPTAAPGVAFNYRYAFRLAAPRVAEVQERHAAMCEELGVARCRITGMLYRVVNDRDIEAMLALKLNPADARQFGRQATQAVVQAEGMLTESEISGVDVGGAIRAAGRSLDELNAELARIEARLAQRGLPAGERERLVYEAEQIRQQIGATRDIREANQESLATTPMVFQYGSGELVPGFAPRPTLGQALRDAGDSSLDGAYVLLRILIALLPWAIVGALLFWIGRVVRRRWFAKGPAVTPTDA